MDSATKQAQHQRQSLGDGQPFKKTHINSVESTWPDFSRALIFNILFVHFNRRGEGLIFSRSFGKFFAYFRASPAFRSGRAAEPHMPIMPLGHARFQHYYPNTEQRNTPTRKKSGREIDPNSAEV